MLRFALFFGAALLIPATVAAQDYTAEQRAEAQAHFEAGRAAFEAGRYAEALVHFERTYAITPIAEVLYNIAHTAERIRHDERALSAFEEYLTLAPDSDERPAIEARIRTLRAAIEERARLARAAEGEAEPPAEGEAEPPAEGEPQAEPERERPRDPEPAPAGGEAPIGGWLTFGVGAAALVTGAVLLGLANARADEVSNAPEGTPWPQLRDAYADADTFGIAGGVLLGLGAAAVALGLVWVIVAGDSSAEVALGPDGVRGAF